MWRWCVLAAVAMLGCDDGGDDGDDPIIPIGGNGGEMMQELTCDAASRRAQLPDPPDRFECAAAPATIVVGTTEMFMYEASHPLATATEAFPCANGDDAEYQAPAGPTEPCSVAGVRPWHTVKWDAAEAACESIGWRLCTGEELLRACSGDDNRAYAYGDMFEAGGCNVREAYTQSDDPLPREAPTGEFEPCESPSGGFDLNGNLWEWTSDREESDARARTYQGAGWRTIAQRHQDINQQCGTTTLVRGFSAASYANPDVGFRCCRRAE
jgi:formylglycine-generating enzyme required for sulfatase activity